MEITIQGRRVRLSQKVVDCIRLHHKIGYPIIIIGGSIRECLIGKSLGEHLDILLEGNSAETILNYRHILRDRNFEYTTGINPSLSFSIGQHRVEIIGLVDHDRQLRNIEGKRINLATQKIIHLTIERMGITNSLGLSDSFNGFKDFETGILRAIGKDFKRRLSFQKILKFLTLQNQFGFSFEAALDEHIGNFFLTPESYRWGRKLIRACGYYRVHPEEMQALQMLSYHHGIYSEEYDPQDKLKIGLHLLLFVKRSPNPQKAIKELLAMGSTFLGSMLEVCGVNLETLAKEIKDS